MLLSPHSLHVAVLGLQLVRVQGCFSMSQLKQALGWPEQRCRDTVKFFLKEVSWSQHAPSSCIPFSTPRAQKQPPLIFLFCIHTFFAGHSLARQLEV